MKRNSNDSALSAARDMLALTNSCSVAPRE
jgi:hypothetical protein